MIIPTKNRSKIDMLAKKKLINITSPSCKLFKE